MGGNKPINKESMFPNIREEVYGLEMSLSFSPIHVCMWDVYMGIHVYVHEYVRCVYDVSS